MENPYQAPETTEAPAQQAAARLTMKQILFSLEGRIPRSTWWMYSILTNIVFNLIIGVLTASLTSSTGEPSSVLLILFVILYIPMFWIGICVSAKRFHDLDKSGWWMLVPLYNFIASGFFSGTPGQNRFGSNPLGQ